MKLSAATLLAVVLSAYAVVAHSDDKWDKCADAAIAKHVEEQKRAHPGDPSWWNLGSGGGIDIKIGACGYAKPPKKIPPNVLTILRSVCKDDPNGWNANVVLSGIDQYGEEFGKNVIAKECQRIASSRLPKTKKPTTANAKTTPAPQISSGADVDRVPVPRTYAPSSCPCNTNQVCYGPRGGRYCITSGGNKRYK